MSMTYQEAKKIIGNQPRWAIHNMILALTMCQWLNTSTENQRLEAAKIVIEGKH